jgi:hypothetical protein
MNKIPTLLSKTKIMKGYRCSKYIYLTIHQSKLETPITAETQTLFDQGNRVGAEARKYFSGGTLIDNEPWDFTGALARTREEILAGTTIIYEAAFEYMGCYTRADIIQYSPITKRWNIYEVKSTTKVKPDHIDDVGLQVWIMAKSSLPIERINILHLNPECCYPDLSNLFKEQDVTEEIRKNYLSIQPKIAEIFTTLRNKDIPDVDIGSYCLQPNECGFKQHCWQEKKIPELSVFNLPGIADKKWQLYYNDVIALDDPQLTDLNKLQERIVDVYKTGKQYIDHTAIQKALNSWEFPLVFLDFETINPAIPRYNGCRPFQQIPFQFSVHILQNLESEKIHKEFLYDSSDDPRSALIPQLLEACGEQGSIVAYYGKFEADRIQELADYSLHYSILLKRLINRIVDPLPIIRDNVYDNAFCGSFSLKSVAPVLLGESYSYNNMLVANGGDAQRAFEELISSNTASDRKEIIRNAMIDYCKKDTLVMVKLVKWLYSKIKSDKNVIFA